MSFLTPQTPTAIGSIKIVMKEVPFINSDGNPDFVRTIHYELEIFDQNGTPMFPKYAMGNLVPHLTQVQIDGLIQFVTDIRAKANSEIIGA